MGRTLRHKKGLVTNMVGAELFTTEGQYRPRCTYEFDGATMYAQMPDWTPLGLPFEVSVEAVPLTVDGADRFLFGATVSQISPAGGLSPENKYFIQYRNTAGTTQSSNLQSPDPVVGQSFSMLQTYDPTGGEIEVNGGSFKNTQPPQSVAHDPVQAIGGRANGSLLWHGPIWNLALVDNSPIQDTFVLEGNGARHITVPAFTIPAGDDFRVRYDLIRADRTGDSSTRHITSDAGSTLFNLDDSATVGVPDRYTVIDEAGIQAQYENAFADIAIGEHCEVEFGRLGGNDYLNLNSESKTKTNVSTLGELVIDAFGDPSDGSRWPTGMALQSVTLENLTTNEYIRYAIDEGSGTVIKAYDREGDEIGPEQTIVSNDFSTGEQADEWTPYNNVGVVVNTANSRIELTNDSSGTNQGMVYRAVSLVAGRYYIVGSVWPGLGASGVVRVGSAIGLGDYASVTVDSQQEFKSPVDGAAFMTLDVASAAADRVVAFTDVVLREYINGTVTPDAAWSYIEDNSRYYPMDDREAIIRDVRHPDGSNDGLIMNYDAAQWMCPTPGLPAVTGWFKAQDLGNDVVGIDLGQTGAEGQVGKLGNDNLTVIGSLNVPVDPLVGFQVDGDPGQAAILEIFIYEPGKQPNGFYGEAIKAVYNNGLWVWESLTFQFTAGAEYFVYIRT